MEYLSSSFNGLSPEEGDFMSQLLGNFSLPNEVSNFAVSSALWPHNEPYVDVHGFDENAVYTAHQLNAGYNAFSLSQGSSYNGSRGNLFPSCYPSLSNNPIEYSINVDSENHGHQDSFIGMKAGDFLNQEISNCSIESDDSRQTDNNIHLEYEPEGRIPEPSKEGKININCCPAGYKKRPRITAQFQRSKRSMKLKSPGTDGSNDNNIDNNHVKGLLHRQDSCCSEDDSNASHDTSGTKRASRGSATDPQSLYARKRRERINERLKILQNLIPNGTKVDISTMLEEAVQYVKFLQLQIKLLSSDELWMYAPIAYNGMDLGLELKLHATKSQS